MSQADFAEQDADRVVGQAAADGDTGGPGLLYDARRGVYYPGPPCATGYTCRASGHRCRAAFTS